MLVPYEATDTTPSARRAIVAVGLGNAIEWYDFAIYGAMATVFGLVFFPGHSEPAQLLLVFAVYGTALLIRPLGAVVFGRLGDSQGRQPTFTIVIALMALATAAVGFLPGYAAVGIGAPIALVALRAVQGFAGGGELGVSTVFLFENAPRARRGAITSLHISTLSLGMGLGMSVAAALFRLGPTPALQTGWWRLAFLLALPLGIIGWYVRHRVGETEEFVAVRHSGSLGRRPWGRLWAGWRPYLLRGFVIMGAGSIAYNTFFIFLPNRLIVHQGTSLSTTWFVSASALVITALAAAILGRLSDRIARRSVVAGSAIGLALLSTPLYLLAERSLGGLWVAQSVIGIGIGGVFSVALLAEVFPPELRATGVAMTAGLGTAFVGGTAPFVEQALDTLTGLPAMPGLYVSVFALGSVVAVAGWDRARPLVTPVG